MLWLIDDKGSTSFNITCCNLHTAKDGEHQVWVEKTNGKTHLVRRSFDMDEVLEIKQAIDFAIERGETALRI